MSRENSGGHGTVFRVICLFKAQRREALGAGNGRLRKLAPEQALDISKLRDLEREK
jgi:hypothetical protein